MAKNAHSDVLDGGLLAVKNNSIRMMLVKAYTFGDSYATCVGNKVAEVVMAATDYTIASSGNNRTLTVSAKSATASVAVPQLDAGPATSGSTTTLADTAKTWTVNAFAAKRLTIVSGTGAGQQVSVTSNTATALTFPTLATAPDATSVYRINEDFSVVHHDNVSKILLVTDETSESPTAIGDTVNFASHVYTAPQPT